MLKHGLFRMSKQFFVGIDLGTTNTVVAYAPISEKNNPQSRNIFAIEQLVAPGEVAKRPMLPSFRYHFAQGEIADTDCLLPWANNIQPLAGDFKQVIIGQWARDLGAKVAGRQVHSAKSWLSHNKVDRHAAILPWGAQAIPQVSPVVASASYLYHIRNAWNFEHPKAPLEEQDIAITVPASFDADARALTVEAASLAGLKHIRLLEEPQAVCYHWYANNKNQVADILKAKKLIMVCDLGGGTTDLSLIRVAHNQNGEIDLTRIGVGEHLMLGGDNIDLALAHIAEQRLNLPKALSAAELSQLINQTRSAKERLLDNPEIKSTTITLLASGSRLMAGAKRCEITHEEVKHLALEGFFPFVDWQSQPQKRRSAVMEFGLPFAADPAITKHFASFISQHQRVCREALAFNNQQPEHTPHQDKTLLSNPMPAIPDCLLLNGGLFNSQAITLRTHQQFSQWQGGASVTPLNNHEPHLAVAYGAVSFLMARASKQKTISGGSPRAFFLVIEQNADHTKNTQTSAVCILPKGCQEGLEYILSQPRFSLRLDQPVNFTLASTRLEQPFKRGEVVTLTDDFFILPPLVTQINSREVFNKKAIITEAQSAEPPENKAVKYLPVILKAELTEVGTLKLDCIEHTITDQANAPSWALEFQARSHQKMSSFKRASLPKNFAQACQKIDDIFGTSKNTPHKPSGAQTTNPIKKTNPVKKLAPAKPKMLRKTLEGLLGNRENWDAHCLRALFDHLMTYKNKRKRSVAHERLWFNLAGFCLRPGFGDAADIWRLENIWPLYEEFIAYEKDTQNWKDFWTFWRRAAGGLNEVQQNHIFEGLAPYTDPQYSDSRKVNTEAQLISYDDVLRLLASLERISIKHKIQLIENLFARLKLKNPSPVSYWAIGRVGTRVPFYSSSHHVIPISQVEQWLDYILQNNWQADNQIALCTAMLARMSGDRHRDINSLLRMQIIDRLKKAKAPDVWIAMVSQVQNLDNAESELIMGETLPAGLKFLE